MKYDSVEDISFIGSTKKGLKQLNQRENILKTCLELGGDDPLIVLIDADLELAIKNAV